MLTHNLRCLLASPRGGVAASPRKWREASLLTPPGWCSLSRRSEHHPVLAKADAARYFLDRSATPPRGDARRGFAFSKMVPNLDGCDAPCGPIHSTWRYDPQSFTFFLEALRFHPNVFLGEPHQEWSEKPRQPTLLFNRVSNDAAVLAGLNGMAGNRGNSCALRLPGEEPALAKFRDAPDHCL